MEIIIRELNNRKELHEMQTLLLEFYREIEHDLFRSGELEFTIKEFNRKGIIRIATVEDEMVGFICLVESSSIYAEGNFGILNELYVIPSFRSKGIGKKLMDFADQWREYKGWSRLEVSTPEESKWGRTLEFYFKEGFVKTGVKLKKG
jgi:GNAT superfamily N-acetyltransferase